MSEITVGELAQRLEIFNKQDQIMFGSDALSVATRTHRSSGACLSVNLGAS
jgi:hypothetical protein